ncbi:MAG: DUF5606 domain-containing protein [Bacteroidetes bacterium]|nr:DUF5606 domain-containing protein [Bacteroidota bacterium]
MDLTKIMTISGKSGLFSLVSSNKTGAIVESLIDQKRFPVFTHEKMSTLEEISVFTTGEDLPLKDLFRKIFEKEKGVAPVDPKSEGAVLRNYFEEVLPEFDKERVYNSDIKKVLTWYNLLMEKGKLDFSEEVATEEETPSDQSQPSPEQKETSPDEQGNS